MGVPRQVAEHLFWSAERGFGVDHPFLILQGRDQLLEARRVGQFAKLSVEPQSALRKRLLEIGEELSAEQVAERFHRQKEITLRCSRQIIMVAAGVPPDQGNRTSPSVSTISSHYFVPVGCDLPIRTAPADRDQFPAATNCLSHSIIWRALSGESASTTSRSTGSVPENRRSAQLSFSRYSFVPSMCEIRTTG